MTTKSLLRLVVGGVAVALVCRPFPVFSQDAIRIAERFAAADQYSVKTRSELSGTLTPPAEKGKPAPPSVILRGDSAIEYDERVLTVTPTGQVQKTLRICRRVD